MEKDKKGKGKLLKLPVKQEKVPSLRYLEEADIVCINCDWGLVVFSPDYFAETFMCINCGKKWD